MIILRIIVNVLYADEVFEGPPFFGDDPFHADEGDHDEDDPKDLYKCEIHGEKLLMGSGRTK